MKNQATSRGLTSRAGSLTLGALLATAGGYLDGYTYVGHGHVFANAMTANIVLLGIEIFGRQWQHSLTHLPPILAFVVGIWAAQGIRIGALNRVFPNPYAFVLVLEMVLLFVLSWLPQACPDIVITTCVAFVASLQVQTFRTVDGHTYISTFTTGNLRSLTEALFDRVTLGVEKKQTEHKARVFTIICGGFFVGAVAGGYVTHDIGNKALWIDCFLLAAALHKVRPRGLTSRSCISTCSICAEPT